VRRHEWIFVALSLAACACEPERDPRPSFVLFLIDTLRADHVGAYGYGRDTTPFIDSLAARGLLFERAVAQAPWTASSMASIWTSRYPTEVGVHANEDDGGLRNVGKHSATTLGDDSVTLAAALGGAGYDTIAVTNNIYASEKFGLLAGFKDRAHHPGYHAGRTLEVAARMVRDRRSRSHPLFLYVHLIDVHAPTRPPPPYDTMYPTSDGARHGESHYRWSFGRGQDLDTTRFDAYRSHKLALYDGALRFIDDEIRRFTTMLEDEDLLASTVIIIASDHGEEFWEHAEFQLRHHLDPRGVYGIGHGHSMSRELLQVPLVLAGPGVPLARVRQQVRNLDIMPTVLGLAGIEVPQTELRGADLVARLGNHERRSRISFSEDVAYGAEAKCIQNRRHKLVRYAKTKSGVTEFFFDATQEDHPLVASDTPQARRLRRRLDELLSSIARKPVRTMMPDGKALEELRSLGYVD
jgi:arylsulfatase A-like enzyme